MDPATETPQGTLVGDFWRFIPRGWKVAGALAILGFAAFQVWTAVDGARLARLGESIRETLDTLPPEPVDPEVADEDNAALVYRKAFRALDRSIMYGWNNYAPNPRWKETPKEVTASLGKNAETLRLIRAALEKPAFAPDQAFGTAYNYRVGNLWELETLTMVRAFVDLREGRIGEAVAAALLPSRVARQVGPGRQAPWALNPEYWDQASLQDLFEAAAHPGFDEAAARAVLRDLPTAEEARSFYRESFERWILRGIGGRIMDHARAGGGRRGRGGGWSSLSLAQKLKAQFGVTRLPPGVEAMPSTGELERSWRAMAGHRAVIGLRGSEVSKALVADPVAEQASWNGDQAAQYRYGLRCEVLRESRLQAVRAAAALRLFEMRAGRAPAALGDLVPEYLPEIPRDPFADGPLLYEVRPDGWTVSSAGPGGPWPVYGSWTDSKATITWKRPAPAPAPAPVPALPVPPR